MSRLPATPLARHRFQPIRANARVRIGLPSSANKGAASAGKAARSASQVRASVSDSAAIRALVAAASDDTPHHLPSGKTEAKPSAAGTNSRPCCVSSAPYRRKNPDPANKDRFIAAQSWRNPGSV